MRTKQPIKEHQDWIEGLLHSGLDPFTMKRFAKRYLEIRGYAKNTKCDHTWINENVLKVGKMVFQFK